MRHSVLFEAKKPWLKLEMSRRTWYRRRAEQRRDPQDDRRIVLAGTAHGRQAVGDDPVEPDQPFTRARWSGSHSGLG